MKNKGINIQQQHPVFKQFKTTPGRIWVASKEGVQIDGERNSFAAASELKLNFTQVCFFGFAFFLFNPAELRESFWIEVSLQSFSYSSIGN